jgi:uncharacterized tellurite resistance protein B-like protein
MAFLDNLVNRKIPPADAAVSTGVATLTLSGDFTELERKLIAIFRDQYPALGQIDDLEFERLLERVIDLIHNQGVLKDAAQYVREYLSPAITSNDERIAAYRYAYALAMANLNIDSGEEGLLNALKAEWNLSPVAVSSAEQEVLTEFGPLHKALAAVALGFIVVTADGQVFEEELENMRDARSLLEPIARLDDSQFALVYDLGLSIYNRFLTDPDNREAFLYNIVNKHLNTRELRVQAFHYAASVAVADGDLARSEVDMLKDVLKALNLSDQAGESIFSTYMSRVRTIDGNPVEQ